MERFVRFIEDSRAWQSASRGRDVMRMASDSFRSRFGIDSGFYVFRKRESRVDIQSGSWGLHEPWGVFATMWPSYYRFQDAEFQHREAAPCMAQWWRSDELMDRFAQLFPTFSTVLATTDIRQLGAWPLYGPEDEIHGFVVLASTADGVMPSAEILRACATQIMVFLDTARIRFQSDLSSSVLDNAVDPMCILDLNGTVVRINAACERTFGWTSEQLVGAPFAIPFEGIAKDLVRFVEASSRGATHWKTEGTVARRDGSSCPVSVTWFGIFRERGDLHLVVATIKDDSVINRLSESLHEARDMYESLFNHTADAIIVLSSDGIVQRVNPAYERIFGWSAQETIGHYPPTVSKDQWDVFLANLNRVVLQRQQIVGHRTDWVRKDGRTGKVSTSMSPILSNSGQLHGVSLVVRDVSAEEEAQEQLRKADKLALAGTLAASVAHEIRNPLTTIKGFLQLLKSDFTHRDKAYELMSSEVRQMEQIITEFLLLAKPTHARAEWVDVPSMVKDVIALMYAEATMNNVVIEEVVEQPEIPRIWCDSPPLKQVFVNVLKNGIEALSGQVHGRIRIEIVHDASSNSVTIRFVDNGPGMTEEQIDRIGEPFYTTKAKGTGLGLMICRRIVANMDGQMHFHSVIGEGTTITIGLPLLTPTS